MVENKEMSNQKYSIGIKVQGNEVIADVDY